MRNPFGQVEKNLGRAGLLFALVVLGAIALSFVLAELGSEGDVAILLVWIAMPFVALSMSKAARAQGKNPWLYGLASLLPPLAIFLFFSLITQGLAIKIYKGERGGDA